MHSIKLFTAGKTEVYFHFSAIFVFVLFWLNMESPTLSEFVSKTVYCIFLLGSVLVHEFGHVAVADKYNLKCDNIYFHAFGGAAVIHGLDDYSKDREKYEELWIAVAGPLASLALAGIFLIGSVLTPSQSYVFELWVYVAKINIVIMIFNLLPIYPMDGGRIVRSLYSKNSNLYFATKRAQWVSVFMSVVASAYFVYREIYHIPIIFLILFLISIVEVRGLRETYKDEVSKDFIG